MPHQIVEEENSCTTGQRCERFVPADTLAPGQVLTVGGRHWQALAAPGHDPDSIMLFDAHHGVKVIAKYHLMEERQQAWPDYVAWFCATPLCHKVWQRLGQPEGTLAALAERVAHELVRGGVLHDV